MKKLTEDKEVTKNIADRASQGFEFLAGIALLTVSATLVYGAAFLMIRSLAGAVSQRWLLVIVVIYLLLSTAVLASAGIWLIERIVDEFRRWAVCLVYLIKGLYLRWRSAGILRDWRAKRERRKACRASVAEEILIKCRDWSEGRSGESGLPEPVSLFMDDEKETDSPPNLKRRNRDL